MFSSEIKSIHFTVLVGMAPLAGVIFGLRAGPPLLIPARARHASAAG